MKSRDYDSLCFNSTIPFRSFTRSYCAPRYPKSTSYSSSPQINIFNQQSHFQGYGYNVNLQYQNQANPLTNLQYFQNNMYVNQQAQFAPYFHYQQQPQLYSNNNRARNVPTQVFRSANRTNAQKQGLFFQNAPQINPKLLPPSYSDSQQYTPFPQSTGLTSESESTQKETDYECPPPVEESLNKSSLSSYLQPDYVRPSDEEMTKALKAMLIKDSPDVPASESEDKVEESPPAEAAAKEPQSVKPENQRDEDDFISFDGTVRDSHYLSERTDEEEDIYGSATSLLSTCSMTSVGSRSQRRCMLMRRILGELEAEKENSQAKPRMTRADLMNVETAEPSKETVEKLSQNNILRESIAIRPKETKSRVKLIEIAAQEIRAQNRFVRFAENKEEIRKIRSMRKDCVVDLQSISEERKKSEKEEELNDPDSDSALPVDIDVDFLCNMDIPENVLKTGQGLPEPVFPDFVKPGKYIPVFVTEVASPFKFWFHIRKEDDDLDLMMNTME